MGGLYSRAKDCNSILKETRRDAFKLAEGRTLKSYVPRAQIVTQIHSFICISPSTLLEALEFCTRFELYELMVS